MSKNDPNAERVLAAFGEGWSSSGVTVLPHSGDEIPHTDCLVVEPQQDAARGEQLLATVEHYVKDESAAGYPWKIRPVSNEPLAFGDAMDLALAYAKRRGVPAILVNQDALSGDIERQHTDTAVLNVGGPAAG